MRFHLLFPLAGIQGSDNVQSLVCNDCGKRFRSTAVAEYREFPANHLAKIAHARGQTRPRAAMRTLYVHLTLLALMLLKLLPHVQEESTEEIKPLTEEEKKQKLEELRAAMAIKRAAKSKQDAEDQKQVNLSLASHCEVILT